MSSAKSTSGWADLTGPARPQELCDSGRLRDGGTGVRFQIASNGAYTDAFAIRHQGQVHAYLNRCAHQGIPLDWNNGEFFDTDGEYLICAAHGALYDPANGQCVGGRCAGGRLVPLSVSETGGRIFIDSTQPIKNLT